MAKNKKSKEGIVFTYSQAQEIATEYVKYVLPLRNKLHGKTEDIFDYWFNNIY